MSNGITIERVKMGTDSVAVIHRSSEGKILAKYVKTREELLKAESDITKQVSIQKENLDKQAKASIDALKADLDFLNG